ncbi:hypothetical protein Zmor_016867 [Zophobas morio]|uniref:Uncharacterized protein n=1 Tax=Zophobas morio TaxID=2755281 RepID=A0AA38IB93_9CUCU|nr:hypothetical protein Zmor_016867 [Zophobas morio]
MESEFVETFAFSSDFEAKTLHLAAFWPVLKSECYFKIDGHMLRNRVQGEGPSSAIYRKFKWTFDMTYEEAKSFDGKPESVFMDMGFLGIDKEMGERINKIVNDNWSEFYDDVKGYYLENARDTWVQIMHGWFARLSLEEAFD